MGFHYNYKFVLIDHMTVCIQKCHQNPVYKTNCNKGYIASQIPSFYHLLIKSNLFGHVTNLLKYLTEIM